MIGLYLLCLPVLSIGCPIIELLSHSDHTYVHAKPHRLKSFHKLPSQWQQFLSPNLTPVHFILCCNKYTKTKTMHINSTVIQRKPVTDNFTIYNVLIHEYAFYWFGHLFILAWYLQQLKKLNFNIIKSCF